MNAVIAVAWLLAAWVVIGIACRDALADLREPRRDDGEQWAVPEQRQPEEVRR